jgi:poly-gamma-glutamate capsule biosynthesis protein CapA/YwtB (metallophosphatase superfamily)
MSKNTFLATGDSLILDRLPSNRRRFDKQISELIKSADVRITNLETTISGTSNIPGAVSGGSWLYSEAGVLDDLKYYGFNMISCANNHALDFSYRGLENTYNELQNKNILYAGIGPNLHYASKPCYLNIGSSKVALISLTSTFEKSWIAGEQNGSFEGRPGINPLRYDTTHIISQEKLNMLKKIEEKLDINNKRKLAKKEKFIKQQGNFYYFGNERFLVGKSEKTVTTINKNDKVRVINDIDEAKYFADYLIISIHSHEYKGDNMEEVPDFLKSAARTFIDNGADAIVCHGPHIIRGIEIYKNKPIFYSLGNFIFHIESIKQQPSEFDIKYKIKDANNLAERLKYRDNNGKRGFSANRNYWESFVPLWTTENNNLTGLSLYPIDLHFKKEKGLRGWPSLTNNEEIINNITGLIDLKFNIEESKGLAKIDLII